MRVVLFGRKPVACAAFRQMLEKGCQVVAVVTPPKTQPDPYPERLADVAATVDVPVLADHELYAKISDPHESHRLGLDKIDLVVSILHQRRIQPAAISLGRLGCINFHPAPLPDYRGWGTYNVAILENIQQWGVAAHFVDEHFDTGPLIRVLHFQVEVSRETAHSLQLKTQPVLLALFGEVFQEFLGGRVPRGVPQGPGRHFSKQEILAKRFILPSDSAEMVDRKIRAFWYPPNPGAQIEIAGQHYTVIDQRAFEELTPLVCGLPWPATEWNREREE